MQLDVVMPLGVFVELSDAGFWTDEESLREEKGLPRRRQPKVRRTYGADGKQLCCWLG